MSSRVRFILSCLLLADFRCVNAACGDTCALALLLLLVGANGQVQVVSDGSYAKPFCTWEWDCTWDSTTQASCAQALCARSGYLGGVFVSSTGNMCTDDAGLSGHFWAPDTGEYGNDDYGKEAGITACCSYTGDYSCSSSGGAVGDPHMFGPHGDAFDFKGRNDTWYNFLSSAYMSVAVYFLHDTYFWRNKVVHGSWMKEIALTAATVSNQTVKVSYSCDTPSAKVDLDGTVMQLTDGHSADIDNVKLELSKHVLSFLNGEWLVEAKNKYLPYHGKNGEKKRLDISIRPISNVDLSPVAPHGLVGQAYDRDDLKVIGNLDNYKVPGNVIVTTAMGEGAIEGTHDDYVIDKKNPFSTDFKFSRFGLSYAPPRNVSSLAGNILPAMGSSKNNAGAVNDEANN